MGHILIYRDSFENMMLVTIKGYNWDYQRQFATNNERMVAENNGWEYSACYETDANKTYLIFTKTDSNQHGHKPVQDSRRLPVYC